MSDTQNDPIYEISTEVSSGYTGHDFIYCIEQDKYYTYKDGVWAIIYWMELMRIVCDHKRYVNKLAKLSINRKKQILEHLKIMSYKRIEVFNSTGRLNFDIGELDPNTGELFEHKKEHYSTMRIPYHLDTKAECPLWIKTLNEILENDKDKLNTLQEFFGYCLTTKNNQKKALLLLGESDSGKSTILYVLRNMVGEFNCSSVQLAHLKNPVFMPQIMNKLINIDADVSREAQEFEAQFKLITSNEPIFCNPKYVEPFHFLGTAKMVMAANIFPKITDHSSAFYNRLIIIPCDRIFSHEEQDKELNTKLHKELDGIFNWACAGLRKLVARGKFSDDEFVKEAVKDLEDVNNPVKIFIREHIEMKIDDTYKVFKPDLYEHYKKWCIENSVGWISTNRFSQCIYKEFHKVTEKNSQDKFSGKRYWKNLRYVENKFTPTEEVVVEQELTWTD